MAKFVMGKPIESFKRPVSFTLLDGTTGTVEFEFKYRTRKQYGEFIDKLYDTKAPVPTGDFSMKEFMDNLVGNDADYLKETVVGWNLDVPFNDENLADFVDTYPAAVNAVKEAYTLGVREGRLGN